jgi:hypothetical protein
LARHPLRFIDMTVHLAAQRLMRSGYFADSRIRSAGGPDSCIELGLNDSGHEALCALGMEAFRREVGRRSPTGVEGEFPWCVRPVEEPLWPHEALARPASLPPVLSHILAGDTHRLLLDVEPDLCWFRGHFPGRPILAGVVQLHLATLLARQLFGIAEHPHEVTRLKFHHPVLPPCIAELQLERHSPQQVRFRLSVVGALHSQGRLNFPGCAE